MLPTPGRFSYVFTGILGDQTRGIDDVKGMTITYCPDADAEAIINGVRFGGAKHATFSKWGNAFSRIANLVKIGYSSVPGHTGVGAHSGVMFRWTQKDLIKYVGKWIHVLDYNEMLAQTAAESQDVARMAATQPNIETYYTYMSDSQVNVMTRNQVTREKYEEEEKSMEGKMVNF